MLRAGDKLHLLHVVPCLPAVLPTSGTDLLLDPMPLSLLAAEAQREAAEAEASGWRAEQVRNAAYLFFSLSPFFHYLCSRLV